MDKVLVRSAFGYDVDAVSLECCFEPVGESLTVQADAEAADINVLVKRFGIGGLVPTNVRVPLPADFEGVVDFHSAMNVLRAAEEGFMELPADVRARFGNDPAELLAFVSDAENVEEARALGLAVKVEPAPLPAEPQRVIVVADDSKAPTPPVSPVPTSL